MESTYTPVFNSECSRCSHSPCVGIAAGEGVALTGLCGPCFFGDRGALDYESWNDIKESTE